MSGLERFQNVGINQHISGETKEGELQTVNKTLFGRPFKSDNEIKTNIGITDSFRKALVKEYGERVTQWAFPSSSYDDRMLKAKPLSGYRIQQIIASAEEARAQDKAKLEKLLPQWAPVLIEKSLKEAGIDLPEKDSEEWQSLLTLVEDEIRQSSTFQNPKDIKGNFDDEYGGVVDKFVKDHKEALKNICQPNHESNDGPETMLEGESSYRSLLQDQDKRWQARENMLRAFGLDHENGSAPGSEDVKKFGIETTKKLGGGAFGEVFEGTLEGKKCIVKLTPPEQMSRERWLARPNEAMSMYLVSNKEEYKNYSENVHIVPPSHYIIAVVKDGQRQPDQLVKPGELRELLKDSESTFVCLGLIMNRAPGDEVGKLMREGQLTEEWEKKQYIKGTLDSIKGLNERGFVHHDLKPGNIFFDKNVDEKSGTTTLIDTGMLVKTPKVRETETRPRYTPGGTQVYMHPRARNGRDHGTETDLYALGVMTLEVDHPEAFGRLSNAMGLQNLRPEGITKEWLVLELGKEMKKVNTNDQMSED